MFIIGLLLALIIGIVLGLVGGGGSILTVPLVHYFFHESMFMATTYSLFVVAIAAALGTVSRLKEGNVDFRYGIIFVIPSMLTAFSIRKFVFDFFPKNFTIGDIQLSRDLIITFLLVSVMFYTAYRTLRSKRPDSNESASIFSIILFGILTGLLSGFIGAGGGFIIVPILLRMGLDMKKSVGTSMFIISIQSAFALLGDFMGKNISQEGGIDWSLLLLITLMTVVGVLFGGYLQRYFTGKMLRRVFSILLIVVAAGMTVQFFLN